MADPKPREGGCRCGKVRFRVTKPELMTGACHCTGCQHMTASAFSLTTTLPADGFEVILGEPVIGGLHGPVAHHFHCDHCKSWVFTRAEGADFFVNVRTSLFDQVDPAPPYAETWTSEKLPWAETRATRSFETQPDMDGWMALTEEYAAR